MNQYVICGESKMGHACITQRGHAGFTHYCRCRISFAKNYVVYTAEMGAQCQAPPLKAVKAVRLDRTSDIPRHTTETVAGIISSSARTFRMANPY